MDWESYKGKSARVAPKSLATGSHAEEWQWESTQGNETGKLWSQDGSQAIRNRLWGDTHRCAFCKGTGEKPKGTKCSVCRGKEMISVKSPAVLCAYCKGRGEERPRTNITCTVCRGKGVLSIQEPIDVCSHCRGTGAEPTNKLPCLVCKGAGVITMR